MAALRGGLEKRDDGGVRPGGGWSSPEHLSVWSGVWPRQRSYLPIHAAECTTFS